MWDGLPFIGGLEDLFFLADLLFLVLLRGLRGGGGGEEEEQQEEAEAEGEGGGGEEDCAAATTGLRWPWACHACV